MSLKKLLMKETVRFRGGRLAYPLIAEAAAEPETKKSTMPIWRRPLLGVNGTTMICHGRSSAKAYQECHSPCEGLAETRLDELIQRDIEDSLRRHRDERPEENRRETRESPEPAPMLPG